MKNQAENSISIIYNRYYLSFFVDGKHKTEVYKVEKLDIHKPIAENISLFFANHLDLHKNYEQVQLVMMTMDFSLVPKDLENMVPDHFMHYNSKKRKSKDQFFFVDYIHNHHAYVTYSVDADLVEMLGEQYENVKVQHATSVWLNHVFSSYEPEIHLNLHEAALQIAVFKKGKLHYYNIFHALEKEDFIYYVLQVTELMGFEPTDLTLFHYGQLEKKVEFIELLKRYFTTLVPGDKDDKIRKHFLSLQMSS